MIDLEKKALERYTVSLIQPQLLWAIPCSDRFAVLQQMQKKELQREIESAIEGMRDQLVEAAAAKGDS